MRQFRYLLDGDRRVADANPTGVISAQFKEMPYGYPYINGGNFVSLSLDPHDGTLMHFLLFRGAKVVTHTVVVSKAVATSRAREYNPDAKFTALGYVMPCTDLRRGENLDSLNVRLRLAYVFESPVLNSGKKEMPLAIDAGDGRVLSIRETPAQARATWERRRRIAGP